MPDATVFLVGTKSDESDAMAVKIPQVMKLSKEWGVEFRAVSSKTGVGIEELFTIAV